MTETATATWSGEFGRAYTDRNVCDPAVRLPAFRTMLDGLPVASVLEVGCNRGHNLVAVRRLLGPEARLAAVEPNEYAASIAAEADPQARIDVGVGSALPHPNASFDLVFTAGVLIHVPPDELGPTLDEIVRVSARYVLAAEYYAPGGEEIVRYRGRDDLLWKRDFLAAYRDRFPQLRLLRSGFWDADAGFDRCHWWLLEHGEADAD